MRFMGKFLLPCNKKLLMNENSQCETARKYHSMQCNHGDEKKHLHITFDVHTRSVDVYMMTWSISSIFAVWYQKTYFSIRHFMIHFLWWCYSNLSFQVESSSKDAVKNANKYRTNDFLSLKNEQCIAYDSLWKKNSKRMQWNI